jgi:phosphomannomutase/phosphoglucomutase
MGNTSSIPSHIFRGYDLRGIADTELTDKNVDSIIKAYASYLISRRVYSCVVGYDNRLSTPRIKKAVFKSLVESGITVYDIGLSLSQITYFASYYFRTHGLIMITASHNPKEFNGFKFGTGFSSTMETDEVQALRVSAQSETFTYHKPKGKYIKKDISLDYMNDLLSRIDTIKHFKIVVDSCNGATGPFLPKILRKAGCTVIEQNTVPDGNFPLGTPDPTEREVQERLAKRVIKEHADLGFSYDTDGDRLGVVDHKGNLMWNDTLVALFAKDILEYMKGVPIVFNTLCSKQTSDTIVASGGKPVMWLTGHSFIKAKVKEVNAPFGGELSGHFFFMDNFYGHDDGAFASLRLLSYLTRKKTSLFDEVSKLPKYISSPEIKLGLSDNIKFKLIDTNITADIQKLFPKAEYVSIDGIRADTRDTMVIIRASQNGPYITVKFEGKTKAQYETLKKNIFALLKKYKEIDFTQGVNTHAFD